MKFTLKLTLYFALLAAVSYCAGWYTASETLPECGAGEMGHYCYQK